ncbi:hypothetical protein [Nocardioides sp.]|uniref:hypothetical protein n=1 Tax=Nocardioides sp. TaxID=35761 RepID=UPI003514C30D
MSAIGIFIGLAVVIILFIAGGMVAAHLVDRRRNQAVAHDHERFEEQPDATSAPVTPPGAPRRD